jgi:hypothetical protein
MKNLHQILSIILWLTTTVNAETIPIPKLLVLPWRQIDSTTIPRKDEAALQTQLAMQLFPQPKKFSEQNTQLPILLTKQLSQVLIDATAGENPLSIEPILCTLGTDNLIFTQIVSLKNNLLLSSQHKVIAKKDQLSANLASLWQATADAIKSNPKTSDDDALQISLSLANSLTRKNQTSAQCLNLLLAEILNDAGYKITRPLGHDVFHAVRDVLFPEEPSARATRNISLSWALASNPNKKLTLPQTFLVKTSWSEAVFGSSFVQTTNPTQTTAQTWKISLNQDKKLTVEIDPEFLTLLAEEKSLLRSADLPSIVKIYGAWAYVDRGRAWGLKMNDRLRIGEDIKGHVVGFYGPKEGLSTPDKKNLIKEGAIIFVRKGQNLTQIGQKWDFDNTEYPTPL